MQEVLDVAAPQNGRVFPAIRAGRPQALGQGSQADQVLPHRPGGVLAAAAGQVISSPPLGRLPQPTLADLGEGEMSAQPERGQVPHILDPFGLGIEQGPPEVAHEAAQHLVLLAAADRGVFEADRLAPAQLPGDLAEPGSVGDRPVPGPLLQSIEDLHNHQPGDTVQADLPRRLGGRFGPTPPAFTEVGIGATSIPEPFVVGAAVASVPPITSTRLNLT
ncbi:MAG: hypothetical protein ACRDR6_27315 [Pseudonocardiaceae bacterium]